VVRREIYGQVADRPAGRVVDPDASLVGSIDLAEGVVVAAGARLTTGTRLGPHTHVNLNATVSRGCDIGGFVTICPGAHIAGGVIVEDDVFLGIGAVIKHELVIGHGALIGAGAVVVEDVKPFEVVVGNPGRPR
jgi:acetyltransferase-like isoleucine patch superfamily enzyme